MKCAALTKAITRPGWFMAEIPSPSPAGLHDLSAEAMKFASWLHRNPPRRTAGVNQAWQVKSRPDRGWPPWLDCGWLDPKSIRHPRRPPMPARNNAFFSDLLASISERGRTLLRRVGSPEAKPSGAELI